MTDHAPTAARALGTRRLERLLRLRHQHPGQHADADRAAALRAEDAGRAGLRPHPAGHRPDAVPDARSTTPGSPTGWPRRPAATTSARCPRASACRTCSSSCFVIMLPIAADRRPDQGLGGRAHLGVRAELRADGRRLHRPADPPHHAARRAARRAGRRLDHLHLDAPGARDVHDAGDRRGLLRHHPGELVRRRALLQRHAGGPGGHRGRHASSPGARPLFGLDYRRHERGRRWASAFASFGFSLPLPAVEPRVRRLRVPRRHPGDGDPVRHLRPGRGDGQRRERRGGRRHLPDHARADRRRRGQPDRLPDGQSVHQRGLHRPSRLEGDGRAHRLLGRHRRRGAGAALVRHRSR